MSSVEHFGRMERITADYIPHCLVQYLWGFMASLKCRVHM